MSGRKIDINKASIDELSNLIGVGRAKAEAIFEARKVKGGFRSINELKDVSGIGPSILEQNHGLVHCGRTSTKPKVVEKEQPVPACCSSDSYSLRDRVDTTSSSTEVYSLRDRELKKNTCPPKSSAKCETEIQDQVKPGTSTSSFKHYRTSSDGEEETEIRGGCSGTGVKFHETVHEPHHSASTQKNFGAQRAFELLSDSESSSSQDECDSVSQEQELSRPSVCVVKKKQRDEGQKDAAASVGIVAALRSRSSLTQPDKGVMKRKSDGGGSKDGSPEKKPCRSSSEPSSSVGVGTVNSSQATASTKSEKSINSHPLLRKGRIPSKANPPPELANWLKTFQEWSHPERLMALDELVELCEPTQVRHVMAIIEPQFQRDFISLLPKELALYVLSYLEPKDLCRAAQTCRYWRMLAEDNLLWREKCKEESIVESLVYENRPRRRSGCSRSPWKTMYLHQKQIECNWRQGPIRPPKVLKGHDDHVITCLEFSGTKIVSGSDDNTLKVWSALSGKCLRTLVGHTGGVWSSQMRDSIIISGSTDRTLKVWNADTGQCVHTLYGHTSTVRCMCLYENRVVSGSRDATLRLWEVDTGHCLHVLVGHVAAVRCVQYDGQRVVSGAYDYMVKVWDPDTETCIHTLQGHTNRVYSLQFDGSHIVSGSLDTSIRVWDVDTGQCLHTLIGHQSLTSGMQLKDNTLVSGNADSTVKVWDIKTGQCLQTLQGPNKHQSAVTCLQFSKKFVITSSDDGTVKVWSLKTGEFLRNLVSLDSGGSGGVVWRIRCSNTKLVCAVGSRNGTEETKLLVLDFDIEENGSVTNTSCSTTHSGNGGNNPVTSGATSPGSNNPIATSSSGATKRSSVTS